jgi:hypothetical protein
MMNTCMCWGFPDTGWEKIIRASAEKIEPRIQQLIDEGREVDGIVFTSSQLKEKYGTGRWYFTFSDPIIDAAIEEFETASETTCEECGEPGKLRGKGWYYTACDNCHEHRLETKARDYLFYEVIQELKKHGDLDAISHLDEWRDAKKKEAQDEQDD